MSLALRFTRECMKPCYWSADRRRKHVENHQARCVIDLRFWNYRAIAYRARSSWHPRKCRIFSHSYHTIDTITVQIVSDGGGRKLKKIVELKWKFNIPSVFFSVQSLLYAYISVALSLLLLHTYTPPISLYLLSSLILAIPMSILA